MNVLVVGVGLQGRAVVHDLDRSPWVGGVWAADLTVAEVARSLSQLGCSRTRPLAVDASDQQQLRQAVEQSGANLVVCMVPPALQLGVAQVAVDAGIHFVSTSYTQDVHSLDSRARERGLVLLTEIGLDPGIDLVMARAVVSEFDQVAGLRMYGGGIPEPEASHGLLRYKVTWTFEGVLRAYRRPACVMRDGTGFSIPGEEIFEAAHIHTVEIDGIGELEAYPNGDALHYAPLLGLGAELRDLGRFALRWPGHCAFWRVLAAAGLLRDDPVEVEGALVAPVSFLARALGPQLQYRDDESDLAVLSVRAWGQKGGRDHTAALDLIDRRDPATGLFGMNRTVGYAASIAAQMILRGEIRDRGLVSPAKGIDPERFFAELRARQMLVRRGCYQSPRD